MGRDGEEPVKDVDYGVELPSTWKEAADLVGNAGSENNETELP